MANAVLVVDDDATARELISRYLEDEGFAVVTAATGVEALRRARELRAVAAALTRPSWEIIEADNGQSALEQMQAHPPDAIVLDLMMPETDGFEFMARLHASSDWRDIPVFVVTALDLTEEDRRRLNHGVETTLSKGNFSTRDLVARIKAVLRHAPPAATATETIS